MKLQTNPSVVILGLVAAIAAIGCGPALDDGDSGSSDGSSDPTEPTGPTDPTNATDTTPVTTCLVDGVEYQPGDEFESSDGCATFRCEQGIATVIEEAYTTVQGDLTLAAQADVDAATCLREVTGTLSISGTTSDVSSLVSLYRVGGNLEVRASALAALVLGGLGEIGGSIIVADNMSLTTLGLPAYMSVFGDATIQNNDTLASLAGAEFLGSCSSCIHTPRMGHGGEESGEPPVHRGG